LEKLKSHSLFLNVATLGAWTICDGNEFQLFITRFEKVSITCRTTVRLFELNTVASGKPAVRECKKVANHIKPKYRRFVVIIVLI